MGVDVGAGGAHIQRFAMQKQVYGFRDVLAPHGRHEAPGCYLEYLDSQRDYFESEISLATGIRNELFAYVLLYPLVLVG